VIEEQGGCMLEQLRGVGTLLRQCTLGPKNIANVGGRFRGSYRPAGKRFEKTGNTIDKLETQLAKLLGSHRQGCNTIFQFVVVVH
jgi:hypothetical protein